MESKRELAEKLLDEMENILRSSEILRPIDRVDRLVDIVEEEYDIQGN